MSPTNLSLSSHRAWSTVAAFSIPFFMSVYSKWSAAAITRAQIVHASLTSYVAVCGRFRKWVPVSDLWFSSLEACALEPSGWGGCAHPRGLPFFLFFFVYNPFYVWVLVSIPCSQNHQSFKCRPAAISATGHSRSLLGHDDELPGWRWMADIDTRNFQLRRLIWVTSVPLVTLIILFVLYPQWRSEFQAPAPKLRQHPDSAQGPALERDLKWLLHPEDHVSREPAVRHFQWNITKASIAPMALQKMCFSSMVL